MTLHLAPFEDLAAKVVFDRLDVNDHLECELVRGQPATPLALWADWRSVEPLRLASFVVHAGGVPFAVFGLSHTGQAGVAAAALLARDHACWRLPLARLALTIRRHLPAFAAERGIHRIEARSWDAHPMAPRLLCGLGFRTECRMPGFGLTGAHVFRQWAWLAAEHPPAPVSACQDHRE